ncbi:helix-turn-helix transcriptional regulator [Spirosoma sp. KNUC1025]|uniref:ArsR/SmtB family transcription factor n=1 Tax=Spirosoma sp. KNUC1025 TaxID=2894082 RepID=UPI00386F64D6|nr:metalloregulator ArsR/SmtB family transcription factor [Spirosoma sp. KNUC1025]
MIDVKTEQAAEILKTLAHPMRLRIMLVLAQQPFLNVSTLLRQLPIEPPQLSQHLTKLKDRGILKSIRQGKEVYYSLVDSYLVKALAILLAGE